MSGLKSGLGFVSRGTACQPGSRMTGKIAPSGYVDCEDIPGAAPSGGGGFGPAMTGQQTSSASVKSSIAPTIITQVSPQISPQFIQQFQPSGSGIQAGTSQGGSPINPASDVAAMLKQLAVQQAQAQAQAEQQRQADAAAAAKKAADDAAAAQAQRQADLDAQAAQQAQLIKALTTTQGNQAPASVAAPAPLSQSAAFTTGVPNSPMPVSTPAPSAAPVAPMPEAPAHSNAGLIVAAVVGAAVLIYVMKRKRK